MELNLFGGVLGSFKEEWKLIQEKLVQHGVNLEFERYNSGNQCFTSFSSSKAFLLTAEQEMLQFALSKDADVPIIFWGSATEEKVITVTGEGDLFYLLLGMANRESNSHSYNDGLAPEIYRQALVESSSAIILLDPSGTIQFANLPAYNSLLEDTHDPLVGRNLLGLLVPQQRDKLNDFLASLVSTHETASIHLAINTRLNSIRNLEILATTLSTSHNQSPIIFCVLLSEDVGLYRKNPPNPQQVSDLPQSPYQSIIFPPIGNLSQDEHQKLLSTILESTTDIVAYTDPQHKIRFMNKAGMERLGVKDFSELTKHSPLDFFNVRDQQVMVNQVLRQALEKGISSGEYELLGLNGNTFPVSYVVQSHPTEDGSIYFSLIARDITAEKEREKQLFEVKQLYETLAEAAQEYVGLLDQEWKILFTNKATYDFLQLPQSEIIGKKIQPIVERYAPQTYREILQIYQTKTTNYIEDLVKHGDQQYWIGSWLVPVKDEKDEVKAVLSVSRNITQEKEAEYNLIQSLEKEREYNELQSRFVSMISHEFKTPLSTILTSIEILQSYGSQLSEEKKEMHTARIQKAVAMMNSYLEDILIMGRIKNQEKKIQLEWMDPVEFCEEIIEESLWNHKSSHPIKFVTTGSCEKAFMDPGLLHQILDNVINNAIHYSNPGSRIFFTLNCPPDRLEFVIRDEGCGIPAPDLEQIYEPFFRGTNHLSIPGTGLGLPIVKRAVDLMKGEIFIQSEVGVGTEVKIVIPLLRQGQEE